MHSKAIITCKKSKPTSLTKCDKKDLKFNILLKQVWDLNSHNIGNFRWLISRKEIWESRKINMPKIIRFSSPFMHFISQEHFTLFTTQSPQKSNSKQQAHATFNRQIHSKKSHVQSHNYVTKFQVQNHIKTSQKC